MRKYVESGSATGLLFTDIRNYYPSVKLDVLARQLLNCAVDPALVVQIVAWIEQWQRQGVPGIPVGPETSGVLGNMCLLPLDDGLTGLGFDWARFSDDTVVVLRPGQLPSEAIATIEASLQPLHLELNDKTEFVADVDEALSRMDDKAIDYLTGGGSVSGSDARDLFSRAISEAPPNTRRFKFAIRTMANAANPDPFALGKLSERPELLDRDPRGCALYLRSAAGAYPNKFCDLMGVLSGPVEDLTVARQRAVVHGLRGRRWGAAEGDALYGFIDRARPYPLLEAEALLAFGRTPRWGVDFAVDVATELLNPVAQRGATLSIRGAEPGRERERAARAIEIRLPRMTASARWAGGYS